MDLPKEDLIVTEYIEVVQSITGEEDQDGERLAADLWRRMSPRQRDRVAHLRRVRSNNGYGY